MKIKHFSTVLLPGQGTGHPGVLRHWQHLLAGSGAIVLLICLLILPARACDYCLLTQGISPLETSRGIGLRLDQRYTRLGTLFDNGRKIDNAGALETHWTTQFTLFYSLTPRLTVLGVVPFARRFQEGEEHHHEEGGQATGSGLGSLNKGFPAARLLDSGSGANGTSFGLSDISLLLRYQVLQTHTLQSTFLLSLQGGLRIPTGKTDARNGEGEVLDAHIQPGTGAFSYLFGASTNYVWKRIGVTANALYSVNTRGEVGDHRYEFGNAFNYDGSFRYRLTNAIQAPVKLFASLGVAGEYRGKEKLDNLTLDDTGGHTLYLAPGVQLFYRQLVFEFSFWQAIYHDLNGEQLGESFKTFGGLTLLIR